MYYTHPHKHPSPRRWQIAALALTFVLTPLERPLAQQSSVDTTHTVVEGDTLSEIAVRYRTSVEQLRAWNDLSDDTIRTAQVIVVGHDTAPGHETTEAARPEDPNESSPETAAQNASSYVVEEADTLGCIASRFGVSAQTIEQLNQGLNPRSLRPGQVLSLPMDRRDALAAAGARRVIREGDTLPEIAEELGATLEELARWNPGLEPTDLRPGRELVIRRSRRVVHVVNRGETVSSIAQRYGVTTSDIVGWNRGLDPDLISVGQRLSISSLQPPTESVGSATCGRLINGRTLPPHPAYVIRDPERSYATEETIENLRAGFDEVMRRHPDAPRVRVHDLSLPEGGAIDDHRSHQSGRDVDIVYYQRDCAGDLCPMRPVLPRQLDIGPQWTLLEFWLRHGLVHLVFIDYGLQEVLYNHARRQGATERELEEWFQYPRSRGTPVGTIRHFRNHFDHVHVRFRCPPGDERCE